MNSCDALWIDKCSLEFSSCHESGIPSILKEVCIVIFDNILVYSLNEEEQLEHLRLVLELLWAREFVAKRSKCQFFQTPVEYLGHLLSEGKVIADPRKIQSMTQWPQPKNIKQLSGFLGITRYYMSFVRQYASIAAPLTDLLKKDAFCWTVEATKAFEQLKSIMIETPLLRLPDFTKEFVIETDASKVGVGAVLMQEGHPLSYFSKKLGPRVQMTSTYNRELYAITESISKWRQYLLGRPFVVRTYHKSLKELLNQTILNPDQQHHLTKLIGYQFTIEYKPGNENSAADSLSRLYEEEKGSCDTNWMGAMSRPEFAILQTLRQKNKSLTDLIAIHNQLQNSTGQPEKYTVTEGLLMYQGRFVLGQ